MLPPNWREENRRTQIKATYQQKPKEQELLQEMEILSEKLLEAPCRQAGGVQTSGRPSHLRGVRRASRLVGFISCCSTRFRHWLRKLPLYFWWGEGKVNLLKPTRAAVLLTKLALSRHYLTRAVPLVFIKA